MGLKKRVGETIVDAPSKTRRVAIGSAGGDSDSGGAIEVKAGEFDLITGVWGERGVRKFMEDFHLICPSLAATVDLNEDLDAALFGIFDGHGGRQTANFIRETICAEIAGQITNMAKEAENFNFTDAQIRTLFKKSFANLDAQLSSRYPSCRDGCTAILAFLPLRVPPPKRFFIISLGDGAAFLARKGLGELTVIPLSETHKPWAIKEKERILTSGGSVEAGRVNGILEVSRCFGDLPLKKYGVSVIPTLMKFAVDPEQDQFILLGCDGFWISWSATEAINKTKEILSKEERKLASLGQEQATLDPRTVCQQLVEHLLVEKKSQDNVSVMLLRFFKHCKNKE